MRQALVAQVSLRNPMLRHEYHTMRRVEDSYWWYQVLRQGVVKDLADRFTASEPCRLLDAGCGTGGMLHAVREARPDWRLTGLDISAVAVAYCRERGFADVREGSIDEMPFPDASFDVVVSLDVLYHKDVSEERAASEINRVLKPGGHVFLNLPAFNVLRGQHDVAVHGARRYTIQRVRKRLQAVNMAAEEIFYWNAWLFVPLLVWRLLSRWLNPPVETDTKGDLSSLNPTINALLTAIGKLDFLFCRLFRIPFGTSVYSVSRKPSFGNEARST